MNGYDLRVGAFLFAALIYALFGSPTPNNPALPELLIAAGLIVAVGVSGAYSVLKFDMSRPFWQVAGQVCLLFGLAVPTLKGILSGHDVSIILRDVAPFLFMFLPLLLLPLHEASSRFFKYVWAGVIGLGVLFSLRGLAEQLDHIIAFLGGAQELTYFANAPTVLFTALFLIGLGGGRIVGDLSLRNIGLAILCFSLAALVSMPIVLTAQRASLGYIVLYSLIMVAVGLWRYPQRVFAALGILALFLIPVYGVFGDVITVMLEKTSLVGFNMRFEELAAVWVEISGSLPDLMLGTGWGGTFESPAVGEVRVNFTHSLLSSALLKTGLIGLALVGLYVFGLAQILWRHLMARPSLVLALAGPFVIDVFLYASFKSLDFGLILLLIGTLEFSHRNSEPKYAEKLQ